MKYEITKEMILEQLQEIETNHKDERSFTYKLVNEINKREWELYICMYIIL